MKNNLSRRTFIRNTATAGLGTVLLSNTNLLTAKNTTKEPRWGVCADIKNATFIKNAGFDYIEESVGRFLVPSEPEEKFAPILTSFKTSCLPVYTCNGFIPGTFRITGEKINHDEILIYAQTAIERARRAGIKIIVFGSGGARKVPEGFDSETAKIQFISLLKKTGPIAKRNNIIIVLEPLNESETNLLNSVEEGIEYVKQVNHPNIQLLADIYHMLKQRETPESILKAAKYLHHVHLAEEKNRAAPGTNEENFIPYFTALKTINYSKRISIECKWTNFNEQLAGSLSYIRKQWLEA